MTTTPALEVRELTKRYGSQAVVEDLTFEARSGRIVAFLGPNGSGKTTTLRAILGLIRPDNGTTAVGGHPPRTLARPWSRAGVMLDGASPHPKHSASAHLRTVGAALGIPRSRVSEVLELVDLTAHQWRRIEDYSLGMKQRLGLATALLSSPDVLVLDEPANGLDPAGNRWLRRFLRDFADAGGAVLVSSHVLSDVALFADDIVVIDDGKLVWSGPADQLQGATIVTARVSEPARLARELYNSNAQVESQGDVLTVTGMTSEDIGIVAARVGVTVFELTLRHRSLEEAFLALTNQKGQN